MRSLRSLLLVGAAALLGMSCAPVQVAAMKDTIKNRIKLAEKYLEENPVEESVEAVARHQMAAIRKVEEVQQFKRNLESIDYEKIRKTIRHTMVKHFTTEELDYIITMYSTAVGRSVMSKMGAYTSEITPKLHEAMQPIMQANADFMAQNLIDQEAANGGVHPAAQGAPQLPPRSVKVPDGVYSGVSSVEDVLDQTRKRKPNSQEHQIPQERKVSA